MNKYEWTERVIHAVSRAAQGDRARLLDLAQTLADRDTAVESLVLAGYGDESDGLMDLVAVVVESRECGRVALVK